MNSVDFIGIGTQRSATTWMYTCLLEHPEICMPKVKETHYLHNPDGTREAYINYFSHCNLDAVCAEFTPNYLYSDVAREHINAWFPETKLIISLRNPIERALSRFHYKKSIGASKNRTFEEKIEDEREEYLEQGQYAKYLKKYLAHFDKKQILVLIYEDIEKNPELCVKKLYQFLGVDDTFKPKVLANRINITAKNRFRSTLFNTIIMSASFNLKNRLRVDRCSIGRFLLRGLNKIRILNKNKPENQIPAEKTYLSPKTRSRLLSYFSDDIKELEQLLERKLDWK